MAVNLLQDLKKNIDASEVLQVYGECHFFQQKYPLKNRKKLGEAFYQPILYRKSSTSTVGASGAELTLRVGKPFKTTKAEIKSFQHISEGRVLITDLTSTATDAQAYDLWEGQVLGPSILAFKNRQEQLILLGSICGVIESVTQVTSLAKYDVIISERYWCPALFAGAIGSDQVDVFLANDANAGVDIDITAIDFKLRKLTLEGTFTSAPATSTSLHWAGVKGNIAPSLRDALVAPTSLYGISGAIYQSLKAGDHTIAASGKLNFAETVIAASMSAIKGLAGEELMVVCNPQTLQQLANELSSKVEFSNIKSGETGHMGFKEVKYTLATGFTLSLVAHPYCFVGEAHIMAESGIDSYGSSPVKIDDSAGDALFAIPGTNLTGYKLMADFAMANVGMFKSILVHNQNNTAI